MLAYLTSTSSVLSESRFLLEKTQGPLPVVGVAEAVGDNDDDDDDDDDSFELDENAWSIADISSDENEAEKPTNVVVRPEVKREVPGSSVKEELRNKIQCRRLSQGVGELQVTFEPPQPYTLTKEEKEKYERRKQKNRDSANRSRLKRKFQLDYLEKEVEQLEKEHSNHMATIRGLTETKVTLNKIHSTHKCKLSIGSRTGHTSSAHAQSEEQPGTSRQSDEYSRGHADFMKLSPEQQLAFLKAYARRLDPIKAGTATNG